MKNYMFLIFFSIVFIIYALVNVYIFRRGYLALAETGIYRTIFLYSFLFLVLSYPAGRILEQWFRNSFTDFLVIIGSFYLGLMVYSLLFILLIDLLRFIHHFIPFFPEFITANIRKSTQLTALVVMTLSILTVLIGHINALFPRVSTVDVSITKPAGNLKELKIVQLSDIHLGTIIRSTYLKILVDKVNDLEPDMVLLAGDIVDEDVAPVAEQNMSRILREINATFGVYAITGNHEYFSGVAAAVSYMEEGNITVLQDAVVKVADAFYLVGRKDRMAERMAGGRKELTEILQGVDKSYPIILMDHQPYFLEVAEQNGIDLQLSGHTHHGQLFPFNFITRAIYELSWGYLQKGNTHYYVSCGVGTWGPPIRTNSHPEIVQLNIRFISSE
jgi:predicted MPP superfamily phosphohydrolase